MKKMKAAVIIVNWNGIRFLKDCLGSVSNQSYHNYDIYFVDNGSTDGSSDYVMNNFPGTKIIQLHRNFGFAGGNNRGITRALMDREVQYIVCLNNDTIVSKNWLRELIKTADSDDSIGAVSSKAYFSDGKTIQNAGISREPALQANRPGGVSIGFGFTDYEKPELSHDCEIFVPGGVAALYKRHIIEYLYRRDGEIFDEDFFAYAEDLDLGFRVRHLGYSCFLSAKATLIHLHSQTTGTASPFKAYYCERNTILTAIKNLPLHDLILFPFRNVALKISYVFKKNTSVESLKSTAGPLQMIGILVRANLVSLFLFPKFLMKRRIILRETNEK